MDMKQLNEEVRKRLLENQQDEINAHHLYAFVADRIKDPHNSEVFRAISMDELSHYNRLKGITAVELKPQTFKILLMKWMIIIFGLTFGIKFFEKSESVAISRYSSLDAELAFMDEIVKQEQRHEDELIALINEEKLNYVGSIVLGLNDALVELTGALAGYTFAFQNTRLIALTGLITGISASLSMAASEYLSTRQDGGDDAGRSALYTGVAYVITVILLILPFLLLSNPFLSLGVTLSIAVLIIFLFNYYISVAKDYPFKKRFIEMAVISLGVAGISFLVGILVKQVFGIDL
ncbi:MAG: rubrerythrin family protein [Clostridiales bacterium 38-18]|nr:MAG: rubrerythrin family protein [Clostridiales bacterium 38-18]